MLNSSEGFRQGGVLGLADLGDLDGFNGVCAVAVVNGLIAFGAKLFGHRAGERAAGDKAGRCNQRAVNSIAADVACLGVSFGCEGTASDSDVADRGRICAFHNRHSFAGTLRTVAGCVEGMLCICTGTGNGGRAVAGNGQCATAYKNTGPSANRSAGHVERARRLINTKFITGDHAAGDVHSYVVLGIAVCGNGIIAADRASLDVQSSRIKHRNAPSAITGDRTAGYRGRGGAAYGDARDVLVAGDRTIRHSKARCALTIDNSSRFTCRYKGTAINHEGAACAVDRAILCRSFNGAARNGQLSGRDIECIIAAFMRDLATGSRVGQSHVRTGSKHEPVASRSNDSLAVQIKSDLAVDRDRLRKGNIIQ